MAQGAKTCAENVCQPLHCPISGGSSPPPVGTGGEQHFTLAGVQCGRFEQRSEWLQTGLPRRGHVAQYSNIIYYIQRTQGRGTTEQGQPAMNSSTLL